MSILGMMGAGEMAAGAAPRKRKLTMSADGRLVDEFGQAVTDASWDEVGGGGGAKDMGGPPVPAGGSALGGGAGYQNPGAHLPSQMPFQAPPPARAVIDQSRAGWQPQQSGLAAALSRDSQSARADGDKWATAIQTSPGKYVNTEGDLDRTLAASANPADQLNFLKRNAAGLGLTANGPQQPDFLGAMGQLGKLSATNKGAEAALEEQLNKQYGLTTRGIQEDALKINEQTLKGKQAIEQEALRGETALKVAQSQNKGGMQQEFAKQQAALLAAGRTDEAKALAAAQGQIIHDFTDQKRGAPAAGGAPGAPGKPSPVSDPYKGAEDAKATQELKVKLGLAPKGQKEGKDEFNAFSGDTAVAEFLKNPAMMKNPAALDALRKAGGGATPDHVREQMENALLQRALPSALGVAPAETSVSGLTILHSPRGQEGGALDAQDISILGPGGRKLAERKPANMPLGQVGAGVRRLLPRMGSSAQKQQELETAAALYKALHGIE